MHFKIQFMAIIAIGLWTKAVAGYFDPSDIVPMDLYEEDYRVMDCYQCFEA